MAHSKIYFTNPQTGIRKEAPMGVSWTTAFFSGFPALFRGHILMGVVILAFIWFPLVTLIFALVYNKMYIKYLIGKGYQATGIAGKYASIEGAATALQIQVPVLETK